MLFGCWSVSKHVLVSNLCISESLNANPLQSAAVTKLNTNQQQTGINQNMEKCISFILKFAVDLTFRPWRAEPSSADLKIILKIAV